MRRVSPGLLAVATEPSSDGSERGHGNVNAQTLEDDVLPTLRENAFVIMMFTGLVQFAFTVAITIILQQSTRRQLRFEVLRSVDAQWQELNKLMMSTPAIQAAVRSPELEKAPAEELVRLNLAYYVINTFQQIIRARTERFLAPDAAESLMGTHVAFLTQLAPEVEAILARERALDPDVAAQLRRRLGDGPPPRAR